MESSRCVQILHMMEQIAVVGRSKEAETKMETCLIKGLHFLTAKHKLIIK